jgi:hypothetical protein
MKVLSFHCPHCNQHIEAGPEYAGQMLDCPTCANSFIVPKASIPQWLLPLGCTISGVLIFLFPFMPMSHVLNSRFGWLLVLATGGMIMFLWGLARLSRSFARPGRKLALVCAVTLEIITLAFLVVIIGALVYFKQILPRSEEAEAQAELQKNIREINPEKFEDAWETQRRLRSEAEAVVSKECSNYVGFTRIMDTYVDTTYEQASNWIGHATIDFVNKQGGVERTNLIFRFWVFEHHCIGGIDEGAMYERERAEQERAAAFQRSLETR